MGPIILISLNINKDFKKIIEQLNKSFYVNCARRKSV